MKVNNKNSYIPNKKRSLSVLSDESISSDYLSRVLREWLGKVKAPRSLRVLVDVDPYSFL
jgi:hypothetical protein